MPYMDDLVEVVYEKMEKSGPVTETEAEANAFRILEGVQKGTISAAQVEQEYGIHPEDVGGYDMGDWDSYEGDTPEESSLEEPSLDQIERNDLDSYQEEQGGIQEDLDIVEEEVEEFERKHDRI